MSSRVLLGVDGVAASGELTALINEAGDFDVPEVAFTTSDVLPALDRGNVDVALLHEDLAPLPMVDLLRQLTVEHPEVGVVVAMREPSAQAVRAVMEAGARSVVTIPVTLEELHTRLLAAASWVDAVRRRMRGGDGESDTTRSRLVAVAGAKGGVGTTSIAVRLALAAARGEPGHRVCLVDLDLQTGDVPSVLGILHKRSIADLVEVAQDITARAVEDSLFVHPTGVRVLLSPAEGELGEDVTGTVAQRVLGALRSMFDTVVVDVGSVATEASTFAVELSDDVLVVSTPDIPSLRAAKRLLRLWARLEVCKPDDALLVVNRASRDNEVQPGLVGRVIGARVARTTIPARFRKLEPEINSAPPDKPEDWALWTPVARLAREIGLVPPRRRRWWRLPGWRRSEPAGTSPEPTREPPTEPAPRHLAPAASEPIAATADAVPVVDATPVAAESDGGRPPARSDRGSGPMDAIAAIFVIGVLFLCLLQAGIAGFTVVMAGRAANAGARAHGIGADAEHSARESLPVGWRDDAKVRADGDQVTVTLKVPLVFGELSDGYRGWDISMTAAAVPEQS